LRWLEFFEILARFQMLSLTVTNEIGPRGVVREPLDRSLDMTSTVRRRRGFLSSGPIEHKKTRKEGSGKKKSATKRGKWDKLKKKNSQTRPTNQAAGFGAIQEVYVVDPKFGFGLVHLSRFWGFGMFRLNRISG
jgi:hypothetical protein